MANTGQAKQRRPGVVGINLKRIRTATGLSQTELAKRAGLARTLVNKIEAGEHRNPSIATVGALASVLGVNAGDLIEVRVEVAPASRFVALFLESPRAELLDLTAEERRWLEELPPLVWYGERPDTETIAQLVSWRRACRSR